jgi:hypothetical protein
VTAAGCLDWTGADVAILVAVTVMGVAVAYLRDLLGGFTTMFPMVGVVAWSDVRHVSETPPVLVARRGYRHHP